MSKQIKTNNIEIDIRTRNQMVVDINDLSFILEEEFPWVIIRQCANGEFYEEVDVLNEDGSMRVNNLQELEILAMNWYFDNVEIVKEIDVFK